MENLCVCERREGWKDRTADSRPNMVDLYVRGEGIKEGGTGREREGGGGR